MIWQRMAPHRGALALDGGDRRNPRQTGVRRLARWSRVAHEPPLVIREPEAAWWRVQDEQDVIPQQTESSAEEWNDPTVTVAVVDDAETAWHTDAVVLRLAELAVMDELLVVYGRTGAGHHAVMAGMRTCLPRHDIVALHVRHQSEVRRDSGARLNRLLEYGSLPVVVTEAAAMHGVTAEISSCLEADRVLRVVRTPGGAGLHQVWQRRRPASVH